MAQGELEILHGLILSQNDRRIPALTFEGIKRDYSNAARGLTPIVNSQDGLVKSPSLNQTLRDAGKMGYLLWLSDDLFPGNRSREMARQFPIALRALDVHSIPISQAVEAEYLRRSARYPDAFFNGLFDPDEARQMAESWWDSIEGDEAFSQWYVVNRLRR